MSSALGAGVPGKPEPRFSSQAGLASIRGGSMMVRCSACGAGLALPEASLIVQHLENGSHVASAQPASTTFAIGDRSE